MAEVDQVDGPHLGALLRFLGNEARVTAPPTTIAPTQSSHETRFSGSCEQSVCSERLVRPSVMTTAQILSVSDQRFHSSCSGEPGTNFGQLPD
jgi:hypothetical protein